MTERVGFDKRQQIIDSRVRVAANPDRFTEEACSDATMAIAEFLQAEAFERIAESLEKIAVAQDDLAAIERNRAVKEGTL